MKIDPTRIMNAREFRASLSAVLDSARAGRPTHITRDDRIDGHLVPPTALVHDGNEFLVMMYAAIEAEARFLADDVERSGFHQAGDSIGMVFGWLWQCDPDAAVEWLAKYAYAVTSEFESRGWARPAFGPLWRAMRIAVKVRLLDGEVRDFEEAVRTRLSDWQHPFTPDELSGRPRPRKVDDPWPDTRGSDIGWAKRRWRHVEPGMFVPNPDNGFELSVGDAGWCRVDRVDDTGSDIVLQRTDGSEFSYTTPGGDTWVPFRCQEPYRWGFDH
ncbi:type II toxin-antitoxin system Phd/YefM family antitoxin [Candidatus Mycobacterium methanotrophicum]|uniref:Immunity protein 63 domain-containing protein n=1 Tax=Candidatus Mycobacterium methanotrophicum TaxID=2943498 RepID=A0ABY4QTL1_9MYCO|nr:hypothetical protein [Candidatus Mycobacterium methanotrophicum]UQX13416.1 hypothetical protein M5I08_24725 [Candidatus Mycobacterium methanotrophicum]